MGGVVLTVLLSLAMVVGPVSAITKPTGCSYSSGVFTCDYRFVVPLDANGFTPEPQRLVLEEASGTFSSTDFINFNNVNVSAFDINFPAELTIYCQTGGGGLMTLDSTSFTGMSFYDEIRIINCELTTIPASAFANFGSVNHFSFTGGNLDNIHQDALLGLNVFRDNSLPTPRGSFQMIDVDLVPGGLPTGFFSNMSQAFEITLSNSRMFTIEQNVFSACVLANRINLDNNPFTYIPDNIFSSVASLGSVSMAGIKWECTCNNLWFLDYFSTNNILFTSPATCTLPSSSFGDTAYKYYSDVCDDGLKCDGGSMPAVDVGVACLTVLQIIIYVFATIGFGLGITALAIAIHTKRQLGAANGGGPKPPGGGKGGKKGPPGKGRPPVKKNAFK